MRILLLIVIRTYQLLFPRKLKKTCLFKESCSKYVYRVTKNEGIKKGLVAFCYRIKVCKAGYRFEYNNENKNFDIKLIDGSLLPNFEVSNKLQLPEFRIDN